MKPADATKPALTPKLRFPEFLNSGPWTEKPLYEAVSPVVREKQKPDVLYKGLGVRSHGKGTFTKENADPEKNAMECLYEVKPHDLVANITFAWEGAVAIVKPEDDGALVSHRFPTYVFNREVAIPEFFQYVISNKKFTYDLGVISPGGAGRNRVLNKNDFLKLRPPIPDVAEQKKIAECLSTLDELIGAESQKLDALKAHKKGLMQQLFPREGETLPRLRFPEFHSAPEWGMVPLGNIAEIKLGKMLDGRKHTTGRLLPYLGRYTDLDFDIDYTAWTISFSKGEAEHIKVSRGEQNIFIWCLFMAMLRSILEKTATFFGKKDFSACLEGVADEGLYSRALNLLSHPLKGQPYPNGERDHAKYLTYLHAQVTELVSNYGKVDILWWDYSAQDFQGDEAWRATDLMRLVRAKQPAVVMNNRLYRIPEAGWKSMGTEGYAPRLEPQYGDFITPEQHIPATGMPGVDWETCMTLNTTWGYSDHDHAWKSDETLIRNLIDIASKGGNYLLNIGPKGDGSLTPETLRAFRTIGAWMKINGESIYGTTASPFAAPAWGRAVRKGRTLYLHVFNWPADGALLVPLQNQVTRATLLAAPREKVAASATPAGLRLQLPTRAPDPIASVIRLELDGEPRMVAP